MQPQPAPPGEVGQLALETAPPAESGWHGRDRSPVRSTISVLIPYEDFNAALAVAQAVRASSQSANVVLAGTHDLEAPVNVRVVKDRRGVGDAVLAALPLLTGFTTVVQPPDIEIEDYRAVVAPIVSDATDVVVGQAAGASEGLFGRAVSHIGRLLAGLPAAATVSGITALRTAVLREMGLTSNDRGFDAELRVKLAARRFRFAETSSPLHATGRALNSPLRRAMAYVHYGLFSNDADNLREAYNTLALMDQAPRYNAWLGRRLRAHLGPRVLEIGAGIGTITRELLPDRELIIALEADAFYFERLTNLFRNDPRVQLVHAPVEATDWDGLAKERLDSVVLSNVLEHIEDDAQAIVRFRQVLTPGGTLVTLVPALPALYGSIDQAVGHFRRYTPDTLRHVIEAGGFRLESLEWMNLLGIPGWFLSGRVLKRRSVPPLQLRVYDRIAPLLAKAESAFRLPVGMSLLAVATAV